MKHKEDIIQQRLQSHWLIWEWFSTPAEFIQHMWCVQAQDIPQATRVIWSRVPDSTYKDVKKALTNWTIVRTRPMRGTLHYMAPEHVHWMLDLCASKTLSWFAKRREFLWISDKVAEKALAIMEKELHEWKSLTRTQLWEVLKAWGIPMQTQWVYHLACYAATKKLICFWPPTEKEETFVLLDEWIPKRPILTYNEQLAELARMYMRGHWPATIDDLARRCGLGKTICKKAVELIIDELQELTYNDKKYYYIEWNSWVKTYKKSIIDLKTHTQENTKMHTKPTKPSQSLFLLWWFDEYFLWYKDRSIVADTEHHGKLFTTNGIFFPVVVDKGRVIGSRKRVWKKDTVVMTLDLLPKATINTTTYKKLAEKYAHFRWMKNVIIE